MPGPKDVKFRLVETVAMPALAGQTRTQLPITEVMQSLNLFLSGTVTVAVADATSISPEGILSLIRNISLEATSSSRREIGRIKNGDFAALYRLQQFLRGVAGFRNTMADEKKVVAAPLDADVQLDFEMPHSHDPRQTLLNTTELSTLNLIIDWGDTTDLYVVGGATITYPTPITMRVSAREMTDAEVKSHKYGVNKFSYQEKVADTTNSRLMVDLKSGYLLRGFLVKSFTRLAPAIPHTPVDTIINSVSLELNREVKFQHDWDIIQGQNVYDYKMNAVVTGYAFIDLMDDGRFDKLIDTRQYRDVNAVFNINTVANGFIRVYPVEIMPANL